MVVSLLGLKPAFLFYITSWLEFLHLIADVNQIHI